MDGYDEIEFCNNSDYDIICKKGDDVTTIEIKEDFMSAKTGNVAVEFECRRKPSGINTSKSDFYLYKIHTGRGINEYHVIKTKSLRTMIGIGMYYRETAGGDKGSGTKVYLFKMEDFTKFAKKIEVPLCSDYSTELDSKRCIHYISCGSKEGVCAISERFVCEYTLVYLNSEDKNEKP